MYWSDKNGVRSSLITRIFEIFVIIIWNKTQKWQRCCCFTYIYLITMSSMGTGRCACCCCFPEGTCCDSWALTFGKQSIFYNFWKEWWKLNRYTQHDCLYTHHPFAGQHRCTRAPHLTRMAESPCGSTCARVRLLHCRLLKIRDLRCLAVIKWNPLSPCS